MNLFGTTYEMNSTFQVMALQFFGYPCLTLSYNSKWKFLFLLGWLHKQKLKLFIFGKEASEELFKILWISVY